MNRESQPFLEPLTPLYRLDELVISGSYPASPDAPADVYDADARPFWGMAGVSSSPCFGEPLRKIEDLRSDLWPEGEDIDEFLQEVRRWREQEDSSENGAGDLPS